MSEEIRARMFDAFTQADASTSREHQGLGIGLYNVARLAAQAGYELRLAANADGDVRFELARDR